MSWEVPSGLNASEVLKIEIYDHETVGKNRYHTGWPCDPKQAVAPLWIVSVYMYRLLTSNLLCPVYHHSIACRILGTLDLSLREVIQRGKHTVSAKLKGKKGDLLDVSSQ